MIDQRHWRSTIGLRTALTGLLAANAAVAIAVGVAHLHRSSVIDDYLHGSATRSAIGSADDAVRATSIASLLCLVTTGVVLIIWQWRSAKNNEALGRIRPRFTPGWGIGSWFIPFANFVIPVRIFQDLWQGSDPENRNLRDWHGLRRWSVIGWWWTFWITGNALRYALGGGDAVTLTDYRRIDRIDALGSMATVAAACLAIVVVRTITRRQEQLKAEPRANTVTEPGWYRDPDGASTTATGTARRGVSTWRRAVSSRPTESPSDRGSRRS